MLNKPLRRAAVRRCLAVAFVGVAFATLAVANPSWAKTAGIDVWNMTEAERELANANLAREQLTAEDVTILNRITAKEALVDEVIAGRLPLADAAAQFLALSADSATYLAYVRQSYPTGTDEVRVARNVIEYVTQRVETTPGGNELLCRLAAELDVMAAH